MSKLTTEQENALINIIAVGFIECMRINRLQPNKDYTEDLKPTINALFEYLETEFLIKPPATPESEE